LTLNFYSLAKEGVQMITTSLKIAVDVMDSGEIRKLLADIRDYCRDARGEISSSAWEEGLGSLLPVLVDVTERLVEERDELYQRLTRRFMPRTPVEVLAN
jgi:hypothetical protein